MSVTHRLRRWLLVPAIGFILVGAPALALDTPGQPLPTTAHVPLVTSLGNQGAGWQGEAKVDANLVGVTWRGDPTTRFTVETHSAADGWTSAGDVGPIDVGPDASSNEAAATRAHGATHASEPVWVGAADVVRIRVMSGSVSRVTLEAVRSPGPNAPSGSAGALGASFPVGPDRYGYALALVLVGVLAGAVALGWSPWRSRRHAAIAIVMASLALTACTPPAPAPAPTITSTSTTTTTTTAPSQTPAQPAITMRSQWGADLAWNPDPSCAPGPTIASSLKFAVIHHTVNSNTYASGASTSIVRAIWQYHVNTLGYCDIAYNFLIDRYGQVFEGRMGGVDKAVVAAHAGGFNTNSTGIALIGTFTSEQPPQPMWDALVHLSAWKLSIHHVDPSLGFTATTGDYSGALWPAGTVVSFPNAIIGHRDVDSTECPGDAFYPHLPELRAAVQTLIHW